MSALTGHTENCYEGMSCGHPDARCTCEVGSFVPMLGNTGYVGGDGFWDIFLTAIGGKWRYVIVHQDRDVAPEIAENFDSADDAAIAALNYLEHERAAAA